MGALFIVGFSLFAGGGILFMAVLFGRGGAAKSRQFAVLSEIFRGAHGAGSRTAVRIGLGLLVVGAITLFAGVSQQDRARAERCRAVCEAEGYPTGAIGPSRDRDPKRRFVACTCSGGDKPHLELRADSLN